MAVRRPVRHDVVLDFERKPFYSPAEVARILGVSDQTVLDRIHDGRLFAVQLGPRLYRVPLGGLMLFLGVPANVKRAIDPDRTARRPDP